MTELWLIAAILAALALVAVGVVYAVRRRRLRAAVVAPPAPRPLPAPPCPIVLAHGFFGFDVLEVVGIREEYFRGVPARLTQMGVQVHVARLAPTARVAARAQELARQVEEIGAPRVDIIAHSMGGLDARYAISRLGLASRVRALVTVGTPHRGTPLADLGSFILSDKFGLGRVWGALGVAGVADLTTAQAARFNEEVPDAPGVRYGCVLASVDGDRGPIHPLLRYPERFLRERQGDNDGLVSVHSQRWGEILGQIQADHWAQIGWSSAFDAPELYAEIVATLRQW
jgi:triacylglycerol lipase